MVDMNKEMQRRDTSITVSDQMAWDEEWDELDDFMLDKKKLLLYSLAVIATAALLLHGRIVLAYPFPFLPVPGATLSNGATTAVFVLICLVVAITNICTIVRSMCNPMITDGVLSAFAAFGIYLFPQLAIHPPFMIAALAIGAGLSLFRWLARYVKPSRLTTAWHLIVNTAYAAVMIVNLGAAGFLPMTAARPASGASDAELTQALESIFNQTSLSDMSRQEIADALQVVVHVECRRLGLQDNEPKVFIGYAGTALADYVADGNRIVFNPTTLSRDNDPTGYDIVEIVTHEMAHAYQFAVVNGDVPVMGDGPLGAVTQDDVRQWEDEFNNAADPNKDILDYWCQDIERRARAYARQETSALSRIAAGQQALAS